MYGSWMRRVLAALVLASLAGPVLSAGDVRRFELAIRDRQVAVDGGVVRVTRGDRVEMTWTTDETVQIHLHGYDIEFHVSPGVPATERFKAHATGRFPVTSHGFGDDHGGHHTLLYLEVHPE